MVTSLTHLQLDRLSVLPVFDVPHPSVITWNATSTAGLTPLSHLRASVPRFRCYICLSLPETYWVIQTVYCQNNICRNGVCQNKVCWNSVCSPAYCIHYRANIPHLNTVLSLTAQTSWSLLAHSLAVNYCNDNTSVCNSFLKLTMILGFSKLIEHYDWWIYFSGKNF